MEPQSTMAALAERMVHLSKQIADLSKKLDGLPDVYVTRREWVQGSSYVTGQIEQLRQAQRDAPAGVRQNVALVLSGLAVAVSTVMAILR